MDRVKQALVSNTETLQQEIHEINLRLNNILQQNKKLSKDVNSLSYDDFISNKEYILNFTTKQYEIIQSLIGINIQLEEYQLNNNNKLIIKNTPKTKIKKEIKKSQVSLNDDESSSDSCNFTITNSTNKEIKRNDVNKQQKPIKNVLDKPVLDKIERYGLLSKQKRSINTLSSLNLTEFKFKKSNNKNSNRSECDNDIPGVSKKGNIKNNIKKVEDVYFDGNLKPPLEPYKNMNCLVSHVVSPSEFYINHIDENIEEIERISLDYSQHHESPEYYFLFKREAKANLKKICLCYIENWNFWYRARVIDWLDSDGSTEDVKVFLVDYGYTVNVTFKNLRPLLKKYADPPECAIKCHVAYLYPLGSTEENQITDWPQDSIKVFKDIIGPENECCFNVVYTDKLNDSWGIDLTKTTSKDEPTIGQQLLDKNQCVEIMDLSDLSTYDEYSVQAQAKTADVQNSSGISSKMTDNEKLERFSTLDLKERENLDELSDCKTEEEEMFADNTISTELPAEGESFQVRITSIFDLTRWYGNITSKMNVFNQLSEQLNNTKFVEKYKMFDASPSLGELIIVKIETCDESNIYKWYRGQIIDVNKNKSEPSSDFLEGVVEVFLVDTGEIVQTKVINLRIITKELSSIPFQAVLLKLHGIKEKEGICNEEFIQYCKENYIGKNLNATVLQKSSAGLLVKMNVTSRRQRNLDVSAIIIDKGYGVISDDDLPRKSQSLKYELSLD